MLCQVLPGKFSLELAMLGYVSLAHVMSCKDMSGLPSLCQLRSC
jgi:hypothetical protein